MTFIQKYRAAKIIFLSLCLSVIENGWVRKTYPFELGAIVLTQEVIYGLMLASSMIWRIGNNANDSAVDRLVHEQINKISNNCYVPHDSKTSTNIRQKDSSGSAVQQAQPMSITKPIEPSRSQIPPLFVHNLSNIADKARAVATQVTHEQVVQAAYTALPEETKVASQELLNNVALDWRKQLKRSCSESIRYARAHTYNYLQMHIQELNRTWTPENNDKGGITYRAPNQHAYVSINPCQRRVVGPAVETPEHFERMVIDLNPEYYVPVQKVIQAFVCNAQSLVYGSLPERVAALLALHSFSIDGLTYGQELYDAKVALYAAYCHKDGSICMNALQDMRSAQKIMQEYYGFKYQHRELFNKPCITSCQKPCKQLIKKKSKVSCEAIDNQANNQYCKQMLLAAATGNRDQAQQIKDNHTQFHDIAGLYNALQAEHERHVEQQEALLKDEYGILHCNLPVELRDPVYTALSDSSRSQLQNDSVALANFNDTLKLRQFYKNALHSAWNITQKAEPVVHQALYAVIDCGTIPERISKIQELISNSQLSDYEQKFLVQAFFLSNGILKDFAGYDRVKSLKMPAAILQAKHGNMRTLLNQLVYTEHISDDQQIKKLCTTAFECIEKALAMDRQDISSNYLEQAQTLYDCIHNQNPIFDKEKLKSCGASEQKIQLSPGSCLPDSDIVIRPEISCNPSDQNRIEEDRLCGSDLVTVPDKESIPCGANGQTLPGFGADEMPISDIENDKSQEMPEDADSNTKVAEIGEELSHEEMPVEAGSSQDIPAIENPGTDIVGNQEIKTVEELIKESKLIDDRPGMRFSIEYERPGRYPEAVKDFYSLNPDKVRDLPNGKIGKHGILPDGRDVIVRLESSGECYPTLEIQHKPHRNKIKFRYTGK